MNKSILVTSALALMTVSISIYADITFAPVSCEIKLTPIDGATSAVSGSKTVPCTVNGKKSNYLAEELVLSGPLADQLTGIIVPSFPVLGVHNGVVDQSNSYEDPATHMVSKIQTKGKFHKIGISKLSQTMNPAFNGNPAYKSTVTVTFQAEK